jgi:bleomycin hydrolase
MQKESAPVIVAAAALVLALGVSCRRQTVSRSERVAERLGRDEAVYVTTVEGGKTETVLTMDLAKVEKPASRRDFTQFFHFPPAPGAGPGTCWSFAAVSFLESETRRLGRTAVKLSGMYPVYWDYVEKARRFIREKGDFAVGQDSEPDAAIERVREHGLVREGDYPVLAAGATEPARLALLAEIRDFLEGLKKRQDWDEGRAVAGVRDILDRRLGKPPETIAVDGRALTPRQYLEDSLGIHPADYVSFISFKYLPPYTKGEYRAPGNWSHGRDYFNLPLYDFWLSLLGALRRGFTAVLAVDSSEPFYSGENGLALVPSFDIPQNFIDASSREFRLVSEPAAADHAVHCVGYKENKAVWYLVKDSLANAPGNVHPGYLFFREDFIRLKGLMFTVHKDAVKEVLARFRAR